MASGEFSAAPSTLAWAIEMAREYVDAPTAARELDACGIAPRIARRALLTVFGPTEDNDNVTP